MKDSCGSGRWVGVEPGGDESGLVVAVDLVPGLAGGGGGDAGRGGPGLAAGVSVRLPVAWASGVVPGVGDLSAEQLVADLDGRWIHPCVWPAARRRRGHASRTVALVYAKTLIPGTRPIPALMATSSQTEVLRPQLLQRGWVAFGQALRPGPAGELRIGVDRLQVVIDGDAILDDDANPASPEGWWAAVDILGGHCIVVILPTGTVDLTQSDAGNQLVALLNTDHALSAALPVVTSLTG